MAYSSTWTKHVLTLRAIFDRLCAASLTLNLAKCEFRKAVIAYPGKQVGQGQICLVRVKVQAIVDFPALKMCRQLCRFLGMVGCKDFSEVVALLACLASPKTQSQKCQVAFSTAKALLCSAPVLATPNFACPFKVCVKLFQPFSSKHIKKVINVFL